MCECGCNEFSPRKILKIGNLILAVEIYPGCEGCETGVILSLYLLTKENAEGIGIEIEDATTFQPDEFGYSQINIPIVSGEDLAVAAENKKDIFDYYDSVTDFLIGNGVGLLQDAVEIRRKKDV